MWTGEQIAAARKQQKLSRAALAEILGSTVAKVANLEKGRTPKPEEAEAINGWMQSLGVEPTTEEPAPPEQASEPAPEPESTTAPAPQGKKSPRRTIECPGDNCRAQVLVDVEKGTGGQCWACRTKIDAEGNVMAEGDAAPLDYGQPPSENGHAEEEEQPVVLVTEDELEERGAQGDDIIIPGSGLPTKHKFELEGYPISNSELQTFKDCRRRWYLAYYRELKKRWPDLTGARAIGTRCHLALAAKYSTRNENPYEVLEETITNDRALLEARGDAVALEEFEKDVELCRLMIEGYLEWVQETGIDEGLEILGDEIIVEAPMPGYPGVNLVGKLDVIARRVIDQALLFIDHKTVGDLKTPTKTLHMNEQMLFYLLLLSLSNPDTHVSGALYNMLKKVKRTARANPPFFDRVEVVHNRYELESHYYQVFGEITDIMNVKAQLDAGADHRVVAYAHKVDDCRWKCDFFAVCPLMDDGSAAEEMLAAEYVQGDPHEHYMPYGEVEHKRQLQQEAQA